MPRPIPVLSIVIADDHALVRDGLRALFAAEPGFKIVGLAADGDEAVALSERLSPDVLLLDLSMPRLDGFGVLARLSERRLTPRTILLTCWNGTRGRHQGPRAGCARCALEGRADGDALQGGAGRGRR